MLWTIISWTVFGLIVGLLARFLLPGRDPMGLIMTILLGIAGSILGGLVGSYVLGSNTNGGFQPAGFLFSLLGAILLVFIVRKMRGTSTV
jgi:uncharacterized membrane protein YeaQ/YmgE (transglycosylase-associated protein family)